MDEEEKQEIKELINLLYNNRISQYGKRKLEEYIDKLQKEVDTLKTTINKQSKDISEQLKELDEKDKVIDLAIKNLNQLGGMYHLKAKDNTYSSRNVETVKMTSEEIKEYFYKKVEEEKDE